MPVPLSVKINLGSAKIRKITRLLDIRRTIAYLWRFRRLDCTCLGLEFSHTKKTPTFVLPITRVSRDMQGVP